MIEQETEAMHAGRGGGGGGAAAGPFQRAVLLHLGAGVNQVTDTVSVPPGLTLVIETVTADIGVSGSDQAFLFVETTASGANAQHTIALEELPKMSDVFHATRRVQLYADPGSAVTVMVTRVGNSGYPDIAKPELVTLSGRLTH